MTQPDHIGLTDLFASRRYFRKFETITANLGHVAGVAQFAALGPTQQASTVRLTSRAP